MQVKKTCNQRNKKKKKNALTNVSQRGKRGGGAGMENTERQGKNSQKKYSHPSYILGL